MINLIIPTTPERKKRLEKTLDSIKRSNCNQELNVVVDVNQYEGYVKSVLRMLNKISGITMIITDDIEVCPNTIQELYNVYTKAFPNNDGLCVYGDHHWHLGTFGLPFAHSNVLKEVINPEYFHNFQDIEMCDVMKMRGKYLPVPTALVKHNHYIWDGDVKRDETYAKGEEFSDSDNAILKRRRENKYYQKVTACLITKDKEYPKEIDTSWFDEVLIKTESPSVYERYLLAEKAKNDIIYVQDDDAIIDYKEIWKHYDGRLTNGVTVGHQNSYRGTMVTLVGWGCFFPKSMLKNFDKYINKYGIDSHLLREADRIFTYLNQPHNSTEQNHRDFRPQIGRMSNEGNHWNSMQEAIEKCKTL